MTDEAKAALEERVASCEAQLGLVRKRMLSMGILIALLAVALIWRTKAPDDLVRSGGAARFSRIEFLDDAGYGAVLDARYLKFKGPEGERRTELGAPSGGGYALSIAKHGSSLHLTAARLEMSHTEGSIEIEPEQVIMLGRNDRVGQTDIAAGYVRVTATGGSAALDGRKEQFGVHLRDTGGKTAHLEPP